MNDPPSSPDRRSINEATASSDPMYWSRVGIFEMLGLEASLGAFIRGPCAKGEGSYWASLLFRSTISRSISAFLLLLPTLLKFESILQSRLRRRHRSHATYTGSVTTSHFNFKRVSLVAQHSGGRHNSLSVGGTHYRLFSRPVASFYPLYPELPRLHSLPNSQGLRCHILVWGF